MREKTREKIKQIVKNSYQATAEEFAVSRQKELWPKLVELSQLVPDEADVLDVGCGNGRLLKAFVDKQINYLGCDQEQSLLNLAVKNWPAEKFQLFTLPDLPDFKFDFIFCIAVWHHIPGRNKRLETLLALKNRLKDSGKIIISVWHLRKIKPLLVWRTWFTHLFKDKVDFGDVFFPWKKDQGKELIARYYHAFSKREIKKLTKQAGLKLEKLEADEHNIWLVLSLK